MAYRSVSLTVIQAASDTSLVDLDTLKDELDITDGSADTRMLRWIKEESGKIFKCVDRLLVAETVVETFRRAGYPSNHFHDAPGEHFYPHDHNSPGVSGIHVSRYPIQEITQIVVDGTPLDLTDIEVDPDHGLLYALSGTNRIPWSGAVVTVSYTGGYEPDEIPEDLQAACLLAVKHRLAARKRDPMLRSMNVPGVLEQQFWVGPQPGGDISSLPPEVESALEPYREHRL